MSSLVWISGASAGIGAALAAAVPFPAARVIDLSRRGGGPASEHFRADLSDPADWARVEEHFVRELTGFTGERVVFIHNAGTVNPIAPAHAADSAAYERAVLLNSAAPQILGRAFLRATAAVDVARHLIMLSSGAATKAYAGWSAYGAGKAAVESWVRTAGAEQAAINGCQVVAVAPGVVDTAMQAEIRSTDERDFPAVQRFHDLFGAGELTAPADAAAGIWSLLGRELPNGACVDLRTLPT
ncbi:SDR family NAD(P)-dependent oxidoreductase [Kribbella sandramycini]|uniref:NAD(P)-dependent dehydrogenase (Short-subunit alcohol dehydrogenase family) n=1 Tax=Kribbella sandramycini TaxID=60450 RepID=A0A7Y4P104_9ACTN|nr:NAD(P)-dependent dehydrogenase (short-subunit alcohol dehydrogenase family) [Kribbella sandramycini]NOL41599.1 SDR family NAD(P)-dependent oxidoreductase [Kribbella sandramycini]